MTPLPSFIELMESLGLEHRNSPSPDLSSSPSPQSSPSSSPHIGITRAPKKAKSSPSFKDLPHRRQASRYSPYSSSGRRGSTSSSSDFECAKQHLPSSASSLRARRSRNQLTVNVYGSASDLPAYTPISSYVRRKTPGASPTSPIFPRHTGYESVDITLPMVPSFPNSAGTDSSFPKTPQLETIPSPYLSEKSLIITEVDEIRSPKSYRRWHTGVRLSTPPHSAGVDDISRRRLIPHFA